MRKNQNGAFMIEILVAMVVLTIGLMGLLALMTNGLKISSTSGYRVVATQEMARMGDDIRANVAAIATFSTEGAGTFDSPSSCSETATCYGTGCTPAEMVCHEISAWQSRLATALPSGSGDMCNGINPPVSDDGSWACTPLPTANPLVLRVCWNESRAGIQTGAKTCIYSQL